jgi:hypothetical protein
MTNRELIINNIKKIVGIVKYNGNETLVTLNKDFIPEIFHKQIDEIINLKNIDKFQYFDILNQKVTSSDIKNTDWGFIKTDLINCQSSIDIYHLNDLKKINEYNKVVITEYIGKYIKLKNLCDEQNIEIKDEKFYKDIVIKNNYNDNLLMLSVLFNIHPQNILENNLDVLKEHKLIWKNKILSKKEQSINTLQSEKNDAIAENDKNTLEEIDIILKMLNDIDEEIDNDFKNIESIKELIYYWPSLLLPAPNMVNYE